MKKRVSKKIILLFLISFLVIPITSSAESIEPTKEEQGGIELDSQRYPYDHYQPVTDVSGDWNPFTSEGIEKGLNGLAAVLFGLTKLIAMFVDVGLENLYAVNIVDSFSNQVDKVSSGLWDNLGDNFGVVLLVIATLQLFGYYVGQRNGTKAGKATLKLITVVILAFVWFSNSSYFLKSLNALSNEVQAIVMASGTYLTDEEIPKGDELEGSQALMRNQVFELLVYKPYLQINYGTTDEGNILNGDETRINELIALKQNEEGMEKRADIAKDEVEEKENMSMSSSYIPSKVAVAFLSIFLAITLAFPLVIIALVNIILQIIALIIAVILPISFIISILPSFSNSGFYTLGKLVGVFFAKIFVGLFLLFAFLLMEITDTTISTDNIALFILNVFVTGVLLILMIKYRDKIVEFVTAGKVQGMSEGYNQLDQKTREKISSAKEKTKKASRKATSMGKGVGNAALNAYGKASDGVRSVGRNAGKSVKDQMDKRNALRSNQKLHDEGLKDGSISDLNQYRENKEANMVNPSANVNDSTREDFQRTDQKPNSSELEEKKPQDVKVDNITPIGARDDRTNQHNIEEQNAEQTEKRKGQEASPKKDSNFDEVKKRREAARTAQINNPNNTPITEKEAKKQIEEQKKKNKENAQNSNHFRDGQSIQKGKENRGNVVREEQKEQKQPKDVKSNSKQFDKRERVERTPSNPTQKTQQMEKNPTSQLKSEAKSSPKQVNEPKKVERTNQKDKELNKDRKQSARKEKVHSMNEKNSSKRDRAKYQSNKRVVGRNEVKKRNR